MNHAIILGMGNVREKTMKKIELDLNKLDWNEIETLVGIVKKSEIQEQPQEQEKPQEIQERDYRKSEEQKRKISEGVKKHWEKHRAKKKKRTRTEPKKSLWDCFPEVHEMVKAGMGFKTAFEQVSGRDVGGWDYKCYERWQKGERPKKKRKMAKRKRLPNSYYKKQNKKFAPVYQLIKDNKTSFAGAFKILYKRMPYTSDYRQYRKYCKRKNKKILMPNKRTTRKKRKKILKKIDVPATKEQAELHYNKYARLYQEIKKNNTNFSHTFQKLHGYIPSGTDYKEYKKYCRDNNLPILMPKAVRKKKDRLPATNGNAFFEFKGNNVDMVRKKLNIGYKGALKILAHYWDMADGDMQKAEEYLNKTYNRTFPQITNIKEKYVPILTSMLAKVIKDSNANIKYGIEGWTLGINSVQDWTEFTSDFMLKSTKIAYFYAVNNKFKLIGTGKHGVINYG